MRMGKPGRRLFVLLMLIVAGPASADELADFTSDGCSSFPDGTVKQRRLWRSCCVVHDLAYWIGGSRDERVSADLALRECVAQVGEPTIAELMLVGVRVGGTPWWPARFRWGYGWSYGRGYEEVGEDEKDMVAEKRQAANELLKFENALKLAE